MGINFLTKINSAALGRENIFNFIIKNKTWPFIQRFKKHVSIDHCRFFYKEHIIFQNKWKGISGIYKISFLPLRLFTYYGSSVNLGQRFKYHYYNTSKSNSFLGLMIKIFAWSYFSVTVIELVPKNKLKNREDWYLKTFMPILNILMKSSADPRLNGVSALTRYKISQSLLGKNHSDKTRTQMSINRSGKKSHWYGKRLPNKILDAAAEKKGIKIFAYDSKTFFLVNNKSFRSLRDTIKNLPISSYKLIKILDTGFSHKGYYFFTTAQNNKPKT